MGPDAVAVESGNYNLTPKVLIDKLLTVRSCELWLYLSERSSRTQSNKEKKN
jgi:hypothetical protein